MWLKIPHSSQELRDSKSFSGPSMLLSLNLQPFGGIHLCKEETISLDVYCEILYYSSSLSQMGCIRNP